MFKKVLAVSMLFVSCLSGFISASACAADFSNHKVAVVYFTLLQNREFSSNDPQADKKAGNAEILADMIAEGTGGDLYSLKTVKKYPSDYDETVDLAQEEQDANARPELQEIPDMSSYDTVFISFPNWWGTYPMAVATFLDKVDLKGKNVIPVCTHEGSRMGHSEADIKKLCAGATLLPGLPVRGGSVQEAAPEVAKWLRRIGVIE
mgnify:CR=1 FL=1